ncbi:MAG: DinB family protein [Bacteroidota bacterium]
MNKATEKKLDTLDSELRDLLKDLEGYSETTLNKKPTEEAWSVFQVMHHLILTERASLQYVKKKLSFNPPLKKAGIGAKFRSVLVNTYLQSPIKRKAPEQFAGDYLPDHTTFWEVVKAWKTDREELRNYLSELPKDLFYKEVFKHPFVGRLTLGQMLSFFQKHYERHHRQIYNTLDDLNAVKIK